ncbi:MAG TPA: hypothetical protein PLJ78_09875 [Anaerolineae bacterium]|nr:hypothetical protein [Anaerolineae bacterium]HQK14236.1 hypothetical protein [Anaerolineae bacterium]
MIIKAIIKMFGKAIAITVIAGIAVGVIGYMAKWDTALAYSNAFFIAGCLVIIAGASSRLGASQERNSFQDL